MRQISLSYFERWTIRSYRSSATYYCYIMSSRYQRQTSGRGGRGGGRGYASGPSSSSNNADAASIAATKADRARRVRRQRIANLKREDSVLDAKFGFTEYDYTAMMTLRTDIAKKERREAMLEQARRDNSDTNDNSNNNNSGDGGGSYLPTPSKQASGDRDDIDSNIIPQQLLPLPPGACGSRRGWVFNMVATTLPAAADENEDAAMSGRNTDDGKNYSGGGGDEDNFGDYSTAGGGGNERSGVEIFLIDEEKRRFKATVLHEPYFYLLPEDKTRSGTASSSSSSSMTITDSSSLSCSMTQTKVNELRVQDAQDLQFHYQELLDTLHRVYQPKGLNRAEILRKMDLDAPNHLGSMSQTLGGRPMIKLIFDNVDQLTRVKKEVADVIKENERTRAGKNSAAAGTGQHHSGDMMSNDIVMYDASYDGSGGDGSSSSTADPIIARTEDPLSSLLDMREHDVPYLVRVCIDLHLRAGCWYTVTPLSSGGVSISDRATLPKANPTVLAFDIECTKAPLKFPDADHDSIFMISYMIDGMGYLLLSRHVVGKDVANFEYTPKPKYPGPFVVINELTEEALIRRFLYEFERSNPQIVVTYNGDFFDWPFLERRAAVYGLDLRREIGFYNAAASTDGNGGGNGGGGGGRDEGSEYRGRTAVHLDAFCWVKRDSYLPQGSQGLKAVTKYKLGYDPVEVDPEDMVRYARERPAHMASYSVSDAVATYYLYDKYVHMFIFSLCTIIPMGPEDVLRKGSGTLCEALLMVEACTKSIICPNKQMDPVAKFTPKGHLLESETYIGGKVECLETGVYRSDIEYKFDMKPEGFQGLINNVDRDMTFAIEVEGGIDRSKITNYDEVRYLLCK